MLAVHGFLADPFWLNERVFSLPWLYELGLDVVLFTLPHHGARQGRGSLYSGHRLFTRGVDGMNEAMIQAIWELRALVSHLQTLGVERVGATGLSLGGWTTALLAGVDERLAFAVPQVPVVSPADLFPTWEPLGHLLRRAGKGPEALVELRKGLALTTALTHAPRLPKERLMVVGGMGDRLAPPSQARLLWEHWGRCEMHWFSGSHVFHFERAAFRARLLSFFQEIGFLGGDASESAEIDPISRSVTPSA